MKSRIQESSHSGSFVIYMTSASCNSVGAKQKEGFNGSQEEPTL